MLIVHIYSKTRRMESIWANSLEEFNKNPKQYYPSWEEGYIATLQEFKHPILDGETLREKTKEELVKEGIEVPLEAGEKVEDKKLVRVPKPSEYHVWSGTEWTVDLEEVKEKKRNELKAIRESKISENIEVHGSIFQVREKDLENFEDVARAIRRKKKTETDTRAWILVDNAIKTFTYSQLLDVLDERALRKERLFEEYAKYAIALEKATSVEEIEKIEWK